MFRTTFRARSHYMHRLLRLLCPFLAAGIHVCAATTVLVNHANTWHYHKGTAAPQTGWKTIDEASLNGTWLTGAGGFGYADNTTETSLCQTLLNDMKGSYSTVFMRRSFDLATPVDPNWILQLTMDWDDAFVAYLDGAELQRQNISGTVGTEPAFDAIASSGHESSRGNNSPNPAVTYNLGLVGSRLQAGTHVLAVVGLNDSKGSSSDFIQVADLSATDTASNDTITGEVTWQSGSQHAVPNTLTIATGATLTIEDGVTVAFGPGAGMVIDGCLLAHGTEAAPVQFTRAPDNTGTWGGIVLNGGNGSPETQIFHATFEFNGSIGIHSTGGTLWLDYVTFKSNAHQYVSLDGSSFVLSHCYFPGGSAEFELVHGTGGIKAGGHGIVRDNFFGLTKGYSDVIDFTGGNRPNQPLVQFFNNVFTGSSDDILDLDGTDAWVEGNIFMHCHKNGAPDTSAAISGGDNSGNTSQVTIIGNLIYDCDEACTAKQGNFFTFINNTVVHNTKQGGLDTDSGVLNVRDLVPAPPTTFGAGFYAEANVVVDVEEQLVRNYVEGSTTVTWNNNILPMPWNGPGTGNEIVDPLLNHQPQLSETAFTNWQDAQILRTWFGLKPGSPAIGTGPNGMDQGGVIPLGASISGEPVGTTSSTTATLTVGINRQGFAIPTAGWPQGSGYVAYKWRLDGGAWSSETPISEPIIVSGLADGPHYVEVVGKRDSGMYQNDPLLGEDAVITRSRTWTVSAGGIHLTATLDSTGASVLSFNAQAGETYSVLYRDAFDSAHPWTKLTGLAAGQTGELTVTDPSRTSTRFYQVLLTGVP